MLVPRGARGARRPARPSLAGARASVACSSRSGKPDVFVAGADIKEFTRDRARRGRARASARGQALFEQLAHLPFPTVAAIDGVCLGGGTELALACDYRVMSDAPKPRIGLPEVRLGIFPAWGGTHAAAAARRPAGRPRPDPHRPQLDARRASEVGLVDEPCRPRSSRTSRAGSHARQARRRQAARPPPAAGLAALAARRQSARPRGSSSPRRAKTVLQQTGGHYPAPLRGDRGRRGGLRQADRRRARGRGARTSATSSAAPVQKNLLGSSSRPRRPRRRPASGRRCVRGPSPRIGVLGAGIMGGGIAQLAADSGHPGAHEGRRAEALAQRLRRRGRASGEEAVARRRLTPRERDARMALISGTLDYCGLRAVRRRRSRPSSRSSRSSRRCSRSGRRSFRRDAIFASNTSSLPIAEIAARTPRPGARRRACTSSTRSTGCRSSRSSAASGRSDETVATVFALAKKLGKTPVVVKDAPGFLVNRVLAPYLVEALRLLEEGCRIEDVDRAMTDFGMPVGPAGAARRGRARRRRQGGRNAPGRVSRPA